MGCLYILSILTLKAFDIKVCSVWIKISCVSVLVAIFSYLTQHLHFM